MITVVVTEELTICQWVLSRWQK